jgi:purine-binding chemotaxis protein CheW
VTINDEVVLPPPDVASDMAKRFVSGLLAMEGRMVSILSLENVLPAQEREEVQ